ncbi:MAG: phosphoribosylaminoimidazolesuccinocarboxamide synthase [Planctomycetota bacterium]
MSDAILETNLLGLERLHRGKVRDVYRAGPGQLLFVASDRISAFDRILGTGIPGKGAVLTQTSNFWFGRLASVLPNHLLATRASDMPPAAAAAAKALGGRAVLVEELEVVPIECVVRGYLASSKLGEYRETGAIQGVTLPPGIELGGELPEPIFTPTTKAKQGHDLALTFPELEEQLGTELAARLRELALALFRAASAHCRERGLLLCDTKFELGRRPSGELVLADEALTPDSSRFFKASEHQPGQTPVPWDKQLVRDYLNTLPRAVLEGPAAPTLPAEIVAETARRYREVMELISGRSLDEAIAEAVS